MSARTLALPRRLAPRGPVDLPPQVLLVVACCWAFAAPRVPAT